MGYVEYDITIHASAPDRELREAIRKRTGLGDFSFRILKKSLDARKKERILWLFRVGVLSDELSGGEEPVPPTLVPVRARRDARVVVVGSGPAGIFAARYLAQCGFPVTVIERGSVVGKRKEAVLALERDGAFSPANNYPFGEGGAGTFSDGKLSSRTKGINAERNYVFDAFASAGAPEEIGYMTHPHLGSDRLVPITLAMRAELEALGCVFRFDTQVTDLTVRGDLVTGVETDKGSIEGDRFLFATGHSAFETYRMLMARGVPFVPKNFAVGFRAEHRQEIINRAQWGLPAIPGVKAAEYRLTRQCEDGTGVYSFCMCPGGKVVPAAAYADTNIVNGMSDFARDGPYANAAIVAGIDLGRFLGRYVDAGEALDWLESLERAFFAATGDYRAPAMTIRDFLDRKTGSSLPPTSYTLALAPADLGGLFPAGIVAPLREGLSDFCRKLKGFDSGVIMGLESKTSSPIQAHRHPELRHSHFGNLYIAGEGSGWSGGIVSSAADGLKAAQAIAARPDSDRNHP